MRAHCCFERCACVRRLVSSRLDSSRGTLVPECTVRLQVRVGNWHYLNVTCRNVTYHINGLGGALEEERDADSGRAVQQHYKYDETRAQVRYTRSYRIVETSRDASAMQRGSRGSEHSPSARLIIISPTPRTRRKPGTRFSTSFQTIVEPEFRTDDSVLRALHSRRVAHVASL